VAKQQMMEAGDSLATIRVMSWLALAYTQAAQLHQAKRECLEGLTLGEHIGGRTFQAGYLYYLLFEVSFAWNRLEEASDWLKRLTRIAQDWQQVELLIRGEICTARLALARGDLETAQQALQQLEALLEQEGFASYAPWVSMLRVHWWLARGNLAEASEWAAQAMFSTDAWDPLRKVARLLAPTEPERNMRVYLDLGAPMKQVLKALLTPAHEPTLSSPTLSRSLVAKLLTRREQEVLRWLSQGASNQEIANALVISLATVKKHVSNLLSKLGAASRTQAIAQARAISLL